VTRQGPGSFRCNGWWRFGSREIGRRQKRAGAASQAKDLFLANISHELGPLTAVTGLADLLLLACDPLVSR
jgi:hypothetical protein